MPFLLCRTATKTADPAAIGREILLEHRLSRGHDRAQVVLRERHIARDIDERAFQLGLAIITLRRDEEYQRIVRRRILEQLVDASTSVGANLAEASVAQSKRDFVSKASISRKEIVETQFRLRLMHESHTFGDLDLSQLRTEAAEVGRIISTIVRRAKESDRRA